jgi:hypothetical protein
MSAPDPDLNPDVKAAIDLVVAGGWSWLSVDKVGQIVGVSGKTICKRWKGNALRLELVKVAYTEMLLPVALCDWTSTPTRETSFGVVVEQVRTHEWLAKLMLQVQSQARLVHTPAAREISQAIVHARAGAAMEIAKLFARPRHWRFERMLPAADRFMAWHAAVCGILAGGPLLSDPELVSMAW